MRVIKSQKFISLKIASKISGYNSDYIGWLIRTRKIEGKRVYSGVSWKTTREAILSYKYRNEKIKILKIEDPFSNKPQRFISLKEAARISGYAPDYIGWLIRTGKVPGKKIYTGVSWQTTAQAIRKYQKRLSESSEPSSELIKRIAAEILGLNKKTSKTFNVGWRFSLAALIIFFLISGLAPIKFLQSSLISALNGEETKTVNFYSTLSSGDWQNPQNVQGPPDVLDNGGFNSFSEVNSAIYKTGPLSLVAEGFVSEESGAEKENIEEETEEINIEEGEEEPVIEEAEGGEEETEEATTTPDTGTSTDTGAAEDTSQQEENIGEGQGEEGTGQEETIEQQEEQQEQQEQPEEQEEQGVEEENQQQEQEEQIESQETQPEEQEQQEEQEQNQGGEQGEVIGILERIKRFFGFEAQAQTQPEWIFQSAKIKFSFAIGEKEIEFSPIGEGLSSGEQVRNNREQEIFSSSGLVKFWHKVENFFSDLVTRALAKREDERSSSTNRAVLIVKAEDITSTTPTEETLPGLDAKIIIWYSLDGENWQKLDTVSESSLSNALNGGYFEYDASFLKNDEDIKNLKIKFEGVVGGETNIITYLDSVWIEVTYKEQAPQEEEEEFELRALKKDWQANETPTFEIVSKGKEESFVEKIIDKISSIFEEPPTPKIEAKLDRPDDEELSLREGEDFSAETHSPTKITVFRPEDFRPGLYKLNVDYEANGKVYNLEEDFTWGVLAINVNKSIYLPNEQAYLQMAVLNEEGHTICDANLTLEITAPDGTKTVLTTGEEPSLQQEELPAEETIEEPQEDNEKAEEQGEMYVTSTATSTSEESLSPGEGESGEGEEETTSTPPTTTEPREATSTPGEGQEEPEEATSTPEQEATSTPEVEGEEGEQQEENQPPANETIEEQGGVDQSEESGEGQSEKGIEQNEEGSQGGEQEGVNEVNEGNGEVSLWNKIKTFFGGLANKIGEKLAYLRLSIKKFTASVVKAEEWTTSTPDITTSTDEEEEVVDGEEIIETGETGTDEQQEDEIIEGEPAEEGEGQEVTEDEEQEGVEEGVGEQEEQLEQEEEQQEDIQQDEQQIEEVVEETPQADEALQQDVGQEGQTENIIYRSPECGPNSVTNNPDYYTYYNVAGPGVYQIKLTAITENGTYEITDQFEVRESVPFDIERIGPTRIWPPATYEIKMKIKVNQDFQGQAIEQVPSSFDILEAEGSGYQAENAENSAPISLLSAGSASITIENGIKQIIWNVSWQAGNTYELRYQFDAPDISPYLYLLGPLRFEQ